MLSSNDVELENIKLKKQLGFAKKAMEDILYCLKTREQDDPNGNCPVEDQAICAECQALKIEQVLDSIEGLENGDKNNKKD